jgi:hypothetical protein
LDDIPQVKPNHVFDPFGTTFVQNVSQNVPQAQQNNFNSLAFGTPTSGSTFVQNAPQAQQNDFNSLAFGTPTSFANTFMPTQPQQQPQLFNQGKLMDMSNSYNTQPLTMMGPSPSFKPLQSNPQHNGGFQQQQPHATLPMKQSNPFDDLFSNISAKPIQQSSQINLMNGTPLLKPQPVQSPEPQDLFGIFGGICIEFDCFLNWVDVPSKPLSPPIQQASTFMQKTHTMPSLTKESKHERKN